MHANDRATGLLVGLLAAGFLSLAGLHGTSAALDVGMVDLINYGNNIANSQFSRASRGFRQQEARCGYESCPSTDSDKLNVHVIAHTHDDVGWLKTVDQYYYGLNKRKNIVGVRHILNSVVPQLVMDPKKRFIYVEMSFFQKWWEEQEEPMRDIVKRLVNEGRLEFINGGWCMNDEATVNYQSTIEQMTLGLKFLNETFGRCGQPKTGWQIDPFGHTSEQASLFAQFGFDSMFVARISYEDKEARKLNKSLDILWHGDRALAGQTGSIYTNIMWDGYDPPHGYCFDAQCFDDEIVDNKKSYEYNIAEKAHRLIEYFRQLAVSKLTNDILMPFGGDFQFMAAEQNFVNIDKLIKHINQAAPDINVFYSTPSCYAHAVYQHSRQSKLQPGRKVELPDKYDDFVPYDSTPTVWWSGYFSSRPSVKLIERQTADLLQLVRLVSFNALLGRSKEPHFSWTAELRNHENQCLVPLWEVLGDLQHHDAVTGTEQQHVADDYVRRTHDAIVLCAKFVGEPRRQKLESAMRSSPLYRKLASIKSSDFSNLEPIFLGKSQFCHSLNISQCEPLEANVDQDFYKVVKPTEESHVKLHNNNHQRHQDHQGPVSDVVGHHKHAVLVHATDPNNKTKREYPAELETRGVLMHAYNTYSHEIKQQDFRLPCMGMCDLSKIRVVQLSNNATLQLIRLPVPAGILSLPHRDATTTFEVLFYADLPALGYSSFLIEDVNTDEIIDDESAASSSEFIEARKELKPTPGAVRPKRIKRNPTGATSGNDGNRRYEYFEMGDTDLKQLKRSRRELTSVSEQSETEKIVVKFDLQAGMIVGLKRASDGSALNITQKFGYYYPTSVGAPAGAYIFRPNTTEPHLMEKPLFYKMYKRKSGALVEIHQKWADWIWQTIRVDSKKNYIEFDYVIGPLPTQVNGVPAGHEVITRYLTDMKTDQMFLTDSNARQLLVRKSKASPNMMPQNLGENFYPVVSTIMLKNIKDQEGCSKCKAEAVSILVDRPQAGTSSHDGQLELLLHRRLMKDDHFGVGEALDEPGEDGRGLVTRGKHRLFLRFPKNSVTRGETASRSTPKPVLFKMALTEGTAEPNSKAIYMVHNQLFNDLSQESRKYALKPVLTFDRLRVTANQFLEMFSADRDNQDALAEHSLLDSSLPANIHLLTVQPWSGGAERQLLIRLENLDNPLLVQPSLSNQAYEAIVQSYENSSIHKDTSSINTCDNELRPRTSVDIRNLIRGIRIVGFKELSLGANTRLEDVKRLDFTGLAYDADECEKGDTPTTISLAPRQIRTILAAYETI